MRDRVQRAGEWLKGSGPEAEIVISSRTRLARNLRHLKFVSRMSPTERAGAEKELRDSILGSEALRRTEYFSLPELPPLDRRALLERHLISKEHEAAEGPRGVALDEDEACAIMVNEEDHLRIQVLQSGFQVENAWRIVNMIDDALDARLHYAFHPQLGYLTACPTNVGTGLRVSVMLHLAALHLVGHLEKVFQAVNRLSLAIRGMYGEGTAPAGHFFQISNQRTLGRTEEQIVREVSTVVPQIVRYESLARTTLLRKDRARLEDRVWQAYGLLRHRRLLSSEDTLVLLSLVRLGIHLEVLPRISTAAINELLIFSQPAHLQLRAGQELSPEARDECRAEFIRSRLAQCN